VLLAAITKSAQLPFSAWLPAAMAAPTPVSSLVHSSTLVTAGVYLCIRFNEALGVNLFLLVVSISTLFIAGLGANYEFDLKKIIALSTLSQLGVIIIVLSVGLYELAFFHLISHAIFKSLLFLCAGSYIHSIVEVQDIRLLGRTLFVLPVTRVYFVGCSFSLCGFPFLAGFYSKDLILERYFFIEINLWLFVILVAGTFFTITYSVRLFYYIYLKRSKAFTVTFGEDQLLILVPISVLFFISLVTGVVFS
jgi:NADH-ubiquinone oxidoreductase chain 5